MSDENDDLSAALFNAFGKHGPTTADTKKRRDREKRYALDPSDGRRLRATGRTKAFNCKMKPELHKRLLHASRTTGVPITVMCELALTSYLDKLDGKRDA